MEIVILYVWSDLSFWRKRLFAWSLYSQVAPTIDYDISLTLFNYLFVLNSQRQRCKCQFFPIWSFTKFFSYLLHMGVQAPNKSIFSYFLQWNWNGNLTQIVLLTSLLRLFLINAVVISKPVVVIIFLLAFFIIFLLQMVHNLGFWLPSQYQTIGILHHLLLQTKSQLVSYLPMARALKVLLLGPFVFQWFHYERELP